jgi:AcrR family transcriptional regulator
MKTPKRPYSMTLRSERAQETRERILEAAMAVYSAGPIEGFTLEEIAHRSETTVQTVLRAFESKENLLIAVLFRLGEVGASLKPTPPGDVNAAVDAIYDLYETMGDVLMRRLADERRYPATKPALDAGRVNHRHWVETTFAPLADRAPAAERAEILEAITVATDIYTWEKLRRDRGLGRAAAASVVRRIVLGLVKAEESDG